MKSSKFVKLILVILIGAMVLSVATSVLAADDGYDFDLSSITGNNTTNTPTGTNTQNGTNTSNGTNTLDTNGLRSNATPTATTNTVNNTYGNTNLPHSGLADSSLPIVALIVIFGISAAYAYKKVQDYRGL